MVRASGRIILETLVPDVVLASIPSVASQVSYGKARHGTAKYNPCRLYRL